jgi:hypothetical protein
MPESGTSGSVGTAVEQSPAVTRPQANGGFAPLSAGLFLLCPPDA